MITKIKAFFSGLMDTKASEFYTGWAGIAMSVLLNIPGAAPVVSGLNWVAENIFQVPSAETLVGILITYAAARMAKKAANATDG